MKFHIKKIPTFTLGLLVGVLLTAGTAVGATAYLKATQSNVSLIVDGTQAKLSDSPVNVNGKIYLPVRDTANALGYSVESVTTSAVALKEVKTENTTKQTNSDTTKSSTSTNDTKTSNNTTTSKIVNNLKETYSIDGKFDVEKIKTAISSGELTINSQDSATGNSLLHYVVLENNYELYKVIKKNALNPNIKNNDGQTPMHIAAIKENRFYMGELKDLKVDLKIMDNSSKMAIDYAEKGSSVYNSLFTGD